MALSLLSTTPNALLPSHPNPSRTPLKPKPILPFSLPTRPTTTTTSPTLLRAVDPERDPPPFSSSSSSSFDPNLVPDEWGERGRPEAERPSEPDPPRCEDEWGPDGSSYLSGNGPVDQMAAQVPEEEEDRVGDLKRCLVDTFYGVELGLRASPEVRAEIVEIVGQLEAANPSPGPNDCPELLDGTWILLYTAFSELLPLIAIGELPFLKINKISQVIDTGCSTIVNATTVSSPFATFSFSASASFEVRTPSRIQVCFKEGIFEPPVISSTVDLPENIDIFGQKVDLSPIQRALNPIQEAAAHITRAISGQPPLKVPIPGERTASWLLTTYVDKDLRISRGDGGLFVLAREGSPLLDQLA